MNRIIQVGGLILLMAAAAICDQKKTPKNPPGERVAPKNENAAKGGSGVKGPPPRLMNPGNPVTRLYLAPPDQRERVLEKLPPDQQERMRKNLADFDHLPKEQQQMRIQQAERFAALPRDRQLAVRQQIQAVNQLPKDRMQAVRLALRRLQEASEEERVRILNSEAFKSRFSPEEYKYISNLSEVFVPPL